MKKLEIRKTKKPNLKKCCIELHNYFSKYNMAEKCLTNI